MEKFSERLKYAISKRGIKNSVLAYKIKCDPSYISNYLSGRYQPNEERIKAMAHALGVSEAWLSGFSTEIEENVNDINTSIKIPVIGYVAAGIPIEAISEVLDYEEISPDLTRDGAEYFALKIKGDSMEPKISNGDVVIVRKQEDCDSGQIAIVCVNGDEATCKKVMKQQGGILLVPLNPTHAPMFYSTEQVQNIPVTIVGRVVELRAKF